MKKKLASESEKILGQVRDHRIGLLLDAMRNIQCHVIGMIIKVCVHIKCAIDYFSAWKTMLTYVEMLLRKKYFR